MKHTMWMLGLVVAFGWMAAPAHGQQRTIQPSPAYYQQQGGSPYGYPVAPSESPQSPVYYDSDSWYSRPAAAAPATTQEYVWADDDEEGIYWVWGQKWPGMAVAPKIGTTGIGVDGIFGINRFLNLRGGFNYGSFTWTRKFSKVKYDLDFDMTSIPLLVDLQPFGGHFRIVGGVYIQPSTEADLRATPSKNVQIGEHTYPPEVVGTLSGSIEVDQVLTPYLGIGFGNAVAEDQLFTLGIDIGVIFQSYDAKLTSDGKGMTTKFDTFRKDLKKEEENIQKDLDDFRFYPVLTISLAWHF